MKQRLAVIVNPQLLERQGRLDDVSKIIHELNELGVWVNKRIEYDDEDTELTEKIKQLTERSIEGIIFRKIDNDEYGHNNAQTITSL